jgi:hypothetical protein
VSEQIHGRVIDGAGRAVAEATVVVVRALKPVPDIAAVSDRHGKFVLGGLSAGTYRLRAVGPDGDEGEADFTVPRPDDGVIRVSPTVDEDEGESGADS